MRSRPRRCASSVCAKVPARASLWTVPKLHEYETWSDARAFDGTATIQQPQTRPLYGGRSAHGVLAVLQGDTISDAYALLRAHWQGVAAARRSGDFERFWHEALR